MREEKKARVFIALKTPPEWERALGELQNELKAKISSNSFRWVEPEKIHLTLRFLGHIPVLSVDLIKPIMSKVAGATRPFTLGYDGLGCFPRIKDPRVLWAGLKTENNGLLELHREVTLATREIGEAPEERPFKPHLTLARVKNLERKYVPVLEKVLDSASFTAPVSWLVTEMVLMQSQLSPKGSSYELLYEVLFSGAAR